VKNGRDVLTSPAVKVTTIPESVTFNIVFFSVLDDGKMLNTKAIQKAIDECNCGGDGICP